MKSCSWCSKTFGPEDCPSNWHYQHRTYCSRECASTAKAKRQKERLFEKNLSNYTIMEGGCWKWLGDLTRGGYGRLRYADKMVRAHRFFYEVHRGPIPDGLYVCHKCDNPSCVNPDHLFVGSAADNKADCCAKNRHAYGARQGQSKLTEDDVREILAAGESYPEIAKRFGVSSSLVCAIKKGRAWRYLNMEAA